MARFLADAVLAFFMSLAVLKVVDFSNVSKRARFFYRIFFEQVLTAPQPETVTAVFTRTAAVVRPCPLHRGVSRVYIHTVPLYCDRTLLPARFASRRDDLGHVRWSTENMYSEALLWEASPH